MAETKEAIRERKSLSAIDKYAKSKDFDTLEFFKKVKAHAIEFKIIDRKQSSN